MRHKNWSAFVSRLLTKLAQDLNVCDYVDYKIFFRALYEIVKKEHPHFTYILFTEELGLGHSNLMNLIVNGQRKLSRKNAQIIVTALGLVLEKRRYFLRLVELDNSRNIKKRTEILEKIIEIKSESIEDEGTRQQLKFYSHWLHGVVFELVEVMEGKHSAETLSARLIPHAGADEVQKSLDLLESMALIRRDPETEQYIKVQPHFIMDEKIQNLGPVAFHNKMIDLAKDSLVRSEEEKRDISSMTLAVPQEGIAQLKAMVVSFQEQVVALAEKFQSTDEVYQINVQLFPLTAKAKRK